MPCLSACSLRHLLMMFETNMNENSGLEEGDIIIPVLGLTGAGKSTFINIAIGEPKAHTSEGILSCTHEIDKFQVASFPSPHRIFLVDTPGFNHTYLEESEVVDKISNWLKDVHLKIAGIIFLHDITQPDYSSLNHAILTVRMLSGSHSLRNVVLTTANWSNSESAVVEKRQKRLADTEWGNLISQGAKGAHFSGTEDSAWAIIQSIVQEPLDEPLQIQRDNSFSRSRHVTLGPVIRKWISMLFHSYSQRRRRPLQ
ncbi:hypothetical protein C8R48DRAFT_709095, partial [Suillus tomentosus]